MSCRLGRAPVQPGCLTPGRSAGLTDEASYDCDEGAQTGEHSNMCNLFWCCPSWASYIHAPLEMRVRPSMNMTA